MHKLKGKVEAYVVSTMEDNQRTSLLDNLAISAEKIEEEAERNYISNKERIINDGANVIDFCECLLAVLSHEMRRPNATQRPSFWSVAEKLSPKNTIQMIYRLSGIRQSDNSRCHAWIRYALKEGSIGSFLSVLSEDSRLLKEFYKPAAFVRDITKMESAKSLILHTISLIHFQIEIEKSAGNQQVLIDSQIKPEIPQEITYTKKLHNSDVTTNLKRRRKTRGNSANIVNIEESMTNGETLVCNDDDKHSLTGSIGSFCDDEMASEHKIEIKTINEDNILGVINNSKAMSEINTFVEEIIDGPTYAPATSNKNNLVDLVEKNDINAEDIDGRRKLPQLDDKETSNDSLSQNQELTHEIIMDEVSSKTLLEVVSMNLPKNSDSCFSSANNNDVAFDTDNDAKDIKKSQEINTFNDLHSKINNVAAIYQHDGSTITKSLSNESLNVTNVDEDHHDSSNNYIINVENNENKIGPESEFSLSVSDGNMHSSEHRLKISGNINHSLASAFQPVTHIERAESSGLSNVTHPEKNDEIAKRSIIIDVIKSHENISEKQIQCNTTLGKNDSVSSNTKDQTKNVADVFSTCNFVQTDDNSETTIEIMDETKNSIETENKQEVSKTTGEFTSTDYSLNQTDDDFETTIEKNDETENSIETENKQDISITNGEFTSTDYSLNQTNDDFETIIEKNDEMENSIETENKQEVSKTTDVLTSTDYSLNLTNEEYRNQTDVYSSSPPAKRYEISGSQQLVNVLQTSASNTPSKSGMEEYYVPGIHTKCDAVADHYKSTPIKNISADSREHIDDNAPSPSNSSFKSFEKSLFKKNMRQSSSSYNSRKGTLTSYDARSFYSDSESDTCSMSEQSFSILADLGITDDFIGIKEDHFSSPESFMGFSSYEELENAISTCKQLIRQAPEKSQRKKDLVTQLVQLRLKLHELKESSQIETPKGVKKVLGHQFYKQGKVTSTFDCDACAATIFPLLQTVYVCNDCNFHCHRKCLKMLDKPCVHKKVCIETYELKICPETGLAMQQYRCPDCHKRLGIQDGNFDARLCDYTGQKYCLSCHWNEFCIIPARVIHNWDFTMYKVSRQSKHVLQLLSKKPEINLQSINPAIFNFVDELRDIRTLREQIMLMKAYLTTCRIAVQEKLLLGLKNRQHFVDNSDTYSMKDLIDIHEDILLDELTRKYAIFSKHIKFDCPLCQGKGFFCETCKSEEVIFPFDNHVILCKKCNSTFHRTCFDQRNCPKCQRNAKRKSIKIEQFSN
ncbi:uncharacterized protein LOC130614043 isoform X2 [Hydractinia symbiolongicarpus]|uniref:uncharacterized protein LOC130614043 isoform X2 n=1 Tax=Hydractinia symbiolongicarpus TaxID=13093 RepID=UPI00254EF79A|nr:uncharacterized protein LOC130614043 isoform X2 [Hydractinia symbiolongicarpus]